MLVLCPAQTCEVYLLIKKTACNFIVQCRLQQKLGMRAHCKTTTDTSIPSRDLFIIHVLHNFEL